MNSHSNIGCGKKRPGEGKPIGMTPAMEADRLVDGGGGRVDGREDGGGASCRLLLTINAVLTYTSAHDHHP